MTSHLQTVAKGLGAGYAAIGALLVHKDVVDVFSKGSKAFVHFQTYHGHPLACAAAYEVQQVIKDEDLVSNCRKMGEYLGSLLTKRLGSHQNVGDIRGRGLLWGVSDFHTSGDESSTDKFAGGIGQRQGYQNAVPGSGQGCSYDSCCRPKQILD